MSSDIMKKKDDYPKFVKDKISFITKEEFVNKFNDMISEYENKFAEIVKDCD